MKAPELSDGARIVFSERPAVPPATYTRLDGQADTIRPRPGRALLVNLWASWCLPCLGELQDFTERQQEIREAGLDVLAITVDGISVDHDTTPANAQQLLDRLEFPFDTGVATSELIDKVALITEERERMRSLLESMSGVTPWPSYGNFILCQFPPGRAQGIYEGLAKRGIFVRNFDSDRLRDCFRTSVGTPDQTDALIEALNELV